jgi:uncharacterized membrane-anchored protein
VAAAGEGTHTVAVPVVRNYRDGYVKDDDAKDWDADRLLQTLKENNLEANTQPRPSTRSWVGPKN